LNALTHTPRRPETMSLACAKIATHHSRDVRRRKRNANHLACDSLVFDLTHRRTTPPRALLWKIFLTWVKPTQRKTLRAVCQILRDKFCCWCVLEIEFEERTKTSIS